MSREAPLQVNTLSVVTTFLACAVFLLAAKAQTQQNATAQRPATHPITERQSTLPVATVDFDHAAAHRLSAKKAIAFVGVGPAFAIADLNGDGRPDLVTVSDGTLGVLLNNTKITPFPTSTTLSSSLNPSIYGQKVNFQATVRNGGGRTATGKVTFTWGIYTVGVATLNSSGVATLSLASLNADNYPLAAVYTGDANNLGSTSAVLNQVVEQTTCSATLTSSPNPSIQGQAVTFTAKITSPTVTAKGPVTFTSGITVLGTVELSGGRATLTTSSLSAGSTSVTVTFNGDSNIKGSSASLRWCTPRDTLNKQLFLK